MIYVQSFKFQSLCFSSLNFSYLNFSCSVVVWLLVQKACLNSELIENVMQWIVLYEMSVWEWIDWASVWIEWIGMIRCLSWWSLQPLEENEHVIGTMTENVSQFVRLIVKECINRIPVKVRSLKFERNDYHLVLIFAWISEVWTECMKLRMMKAMFDCDSHLAKKLTKCLNDLSLAPSLSWMNYWLIEP